MSYNKCEIFIIERKPLRGKIIYDGYGNMLLKENA